MINSPNSSAKPNNRYLTQKYNLWPDYSRPIAIVNLDIGQTITIYPHDNIRQVVDNFCHNNDLEEDCANFLYISICQQIGEKAKENIHIHPPSFGVKQDYLAESFGNPCGTQKDSGTIQTEASNHTTNQSLSEKNDQILASNYEKWHQLIKDAGPKQNTSKPGTGTVSKRNLFTQEITHHSSSQLQNINSKEGQRSSPNIFNKLYEEGLQQHRIRQEVQQLNVQHKQETEMKQATFKPIISSKSKQLAQMQRERGVKRQTKKPIYQPQTFSHQPQISPNTKRIIETKEKSRSNTPIHTKLYTEAIQTERMKQQWAQEQFEKRHPFTIPDRSKSPSSNLASHKKQQETLVRLLQDRSKQELNSNRQTSPSQIKATVQPKSIGHTRQPSNQTHVFTHQEIDMATRKVFELLDSDRDGLISDSKCDLSKIDGWTLDILSTVLFTMEDEDLVFNWQSFRDMCITKGVEEQLIRQVSVPTPNNRSFKTLF